MLLNNQWITEEIRGNQKIPRNKWQWKHDNPKPMECSKSSSKREVYSNKIVPKKQEKLKQSNLTPKGTRKRRRTTTTKIKTQS